MAPDLSFREILPGSAEYAAMLRLRASVLRHPLGLELFPEDLADEPHCIHLAALSAEEVVGTLLLKPLDPHTVKMRQVAIRPDLQGHGIGAGLVRFAETLAQARGFRRLVAHARSTALPFYLRLGYRAEGEPFLETTVPHVFISRDLD